MRGIKKKSFDDGVGGAVFVFRLRRKGRHGDSSVGCFGIASGLPCGIVMLVLAGAVYFKRKEND